MKIRVDFTLDIPKGSIPGLLDLAGGAQTPTEAADFFRGEALEYLVGYLADNGVRVYVSRRNDGLDVDSVASRQLG